MFFYLLLNNTYILIIKNLVNITYMIILVQTHKYILLIQTNTFSILHDIKLSFNDINIDI